MMYKIMTACLYPSNLTEYTWVESVEVDGATGWDDVSAFVEQCVDGIEIISEMPNYSSIHNLPDGAIIVTPREGEGGHMTHFELYWKEVA